MLHANAYALLLRINALAERDPAWLSEESLKDLSHPGRCVQWLSDRRERLPRELIPLSRLEPLAGMLSSFFDTSFDVKSVVVNGVLVNAKVKRKRVGSGRRAAETIVALAIRHQLSRDGCKLDDEEARRLCRSGETCEHALVSAYVWELERRAVGKSKGAIAHRIWMDMPHELRTRLDPQVVEHARQTLLAHAHKLAANRGGETAEE